MRLRTARRDGLPAALLLFDLDHFKSINDRFGHFVGDQTLRAFARIASGAIRQSDVFGRFGGEEFAAFLPGADVRTAHLIAERIRSDFSQMTLAPDWPPPTVSVGVAAVVPAATPISRRFSFRPTGPSTRPSAAVGIASSALSRW